MTQIAELRPADPIALLRAELALMDSELGEDGAEVRRIMEYALDQWMVRMEGRS
jgi:hypothetical protein